MMKREDLFTDFRVTEMDLTIAGYVIKKPGHISGEDWLAAWRDADIAYSEGREDGLIEGREENAEDM